MQLVLLVSFLVCFQVAQVPEALPTRSAVTGSFSSLVCLLVSHQGVDLSETLPTFRTSMGRPEVAQHFRMVDSQ